MVFDDVIANEILELIFRIKNPNFPVICKEKMDY